MPRKPKQPSGNQGGGSLRVPDWIANDKIAVTEFKRIGKQMIEARVMNFITEASLAMYARSFSEFTTEDLYVRDEGTQLSGANGRFTNPRVWVRNRAREQMERTLKDLGRLLKALPGSGGGTSKGLAEEMMRQLGEAPPIDKDDEDWEPPALQVKA